MTRNIIHKEKKIRPNIDTTNNTDNSVLNFVNYNPNKSSHMKIKEYLDVNPS